MAHCFQCGRIIPAPGPYLRRKVQTGEWARRRYPKRTLIAVSTRFGFRIVCSKCARRIDLALTRRDWVQLVELILALIVLAVILIAKWLG